MPCYWFFFFILVDCANAYHKYKKNKIPIWFESFSSKSIWRNQYNHIISRTHTYTPSSQIFHLHPITVSWLFTYEKHCFIELKDCMVIVTHALKRSSVIMFSGKPTEGVNSVFWLIFFFVSNTQNQNRHSSISSFKQMHFQYNLNWWKLSNGDGFAVSMELFKKTKLSISFI